MRLPNLLRIWPARPIGLALAMALATCVATRAAHALTGPATLPQTTRGNTWVCTSPGVTSNSPLTEAQHPEIVLIFWEDSVSGPVWSQDHDNNNNPPPVTYGQWIAWTLSLVNGPYFAGLSQYGSPGDLTNTGGGISPPRMSPMAPIWNTAAPSGGNTGNFFKSDVQSIIEQEILNGAVPNIPQPLDDMLYVVIPPPGDSANDCLNGGCNDTVTFQNANNNLWYVRIIIGNPFGGGPGQTLSHEVTEPIAGWAGTVMTGCTDNGRTSQSIGVGICDWCGNVQETQNGVKVQAYWSQVDQACIIPEAWGNLLVNHDVNLSPPTFGWAAPPNDFPMRQIYGGAGGVIGTGADDNLYYYNDGAGAWYQTGGGPGSEFAAGGDSILQLPTDTSQGASWYSVTTNTWHSLPPLPNGPITSVAVVNTEDGVLVVTDRFGQPWLWDSTISQWVVIGGPGDQFIASGGNLLGLTVDHFGVWEYPQSEFMDDFSTRIVRPGPGNIGTKWVRQDMSVGQVAEIVAGPEDNAGVYWGVVPYGGSALYYQGNARVGGGDNSRDWVASAEAGGFLSMDTGTQDVFKNYFAPAQPPSSTIGTWSETGVYGPAGRLVGGTAMYVTACNGGFDSLAGAAPCDVLIRPSNPPALPSPPTFPPGCSFVTPRADEHSGFGIGTLVFGAALLARRRVKRR